ncbi:MAG: hypothetical protein JGK37_09550 [Microcoleus sp. PH2017_06_SFM_O_A]|nr:hypothetical protein [Microcoleus sp. PH2017_06_SFM_O_A]
MPYILGKTEFSSVSNLLARPQPQHGTLFELTPNPCYSDTLDPFTLQLHRKTSPACLWL